MSTITAPAGVGVGRLPAARTGAPARTSARTSSPPLRMTRRARLLLSALCLIVLVAAAVLATGGGSARAGHQTGPAGASDHVERVTVAPGDTLWAIAAREAPDVDPRETIADILELNALDSAAVRAGQVLLVP